MSKRTIGELRDNLEVIMRRRTNGHKVSTDALVAELRKGNDRLLENLAKQLIDRALVKLVSDVARRKLKPGDGRQGDLFQGIRGIQQIVEIEVDGEKLWCGFGDLTVEQIRKWATGKRAARSAKLDRLTPIEMLLRRIDAARIDPGTTILDAVSRLQNA